MKLALMGLRGAGKTTVGRALAERTGWSFVDTDDLVRARTGRTVAELFADGSFRSVERSVVEDTLSTAEGVVALGGGAVLDEGFEAASAGWTRVWLRATTPVLAQRLRGDPTERPSLTGSDPIEEIDTLARTRHDRYATLAHFSVETDTL
ncbi:MAG: shikimate kinase, partial [Planctomycetota bacterium]